MPASTCFRETSTRIGLPSTLVEKDFWVCLTLKHLFSIEAFRGKILFKGGTSLSKVFNAIHRFSEDIDLAIDFETLWLRWLKTSIGCAVEEQAAEAS